MAGAQGGMDFSAPFRYCLELRSGYFQLIGIRMVKLTVRERESIQEAVRRFRKLVERSGIKKEMRRREFFEKPSETRRRARLRAERRTKRNRLLGV
jgi:small subunit ribosomal protein S21